MACEASASPSLLWPVSDRASTAAARIPASILVIGSGTTRFTLPTLVGYAPIKAALEVFVRHVAKIAGSRGITANAVAPGALETDFTAPAFAAAPQMRGVIAQNTALGRAAKSLRIRSAAWSLAQDSEGL